MWPQAAKFLSDPGAVCVCVYAPAGLRQRCPTAVSLLLSLGVLTVSPLIFFPLVLFSCSFLAWACVAAIVYEAMFAPSNCVFVYVRVCVRVQHGFMQQIARMSFKKKKNPRMLNFIYKIFNMHKIKFLKVYCLLLLTLESPTYELHHPKQWFLDFLSSDMPTQRPTWESIYQHQMFSIGFLKLDVSV